MFFKKKGTNEKIDKETKEKNKDKSKKKFLDKPVKLKSATGIRVARFTLWALIVFLTIRGAVSVLRPDPINSILDSQKNFEAKLSKENLLESRAFSFAENFTEEYFNLFFGDSEDYTNRLSKYMDKEIINSLDRSGYMTTDYVKAYSVERYSETQVDVFVYAKVQFRTEKPEQDKIQDVTKKQYDINQRDVYVKVPIYFDENGNMIVEDAPLLVAAPEKVNYKLKDSYLGKEVANNDTTNAIKDSLNQFLKSYYQEDQTQVDYFLKTPGSIKAVRSDNSFNGIESIKVIVLGSNKYKAIVENKITSSGKNLKQKVNLDLVFEGDKYLIESMDTRTLNIK